MNFQVQGKLKLIDRYKILAFIFSITLFFFGQYSLNHFPTGLFEDDTYFYYSTAYNSLIHGFITFDGINVTNGFHPLWMLFLIFFALPLKIIGITSPVIYGALFNLLASFIWYLIFLNLKNIWTQILAFSFSLISGFGMEGGLAGLIIIQIFKDYFKESTSKKDWLFLALILTRIDLAIVPLILSFKKNKYKIFKQVRPYFVILIGILLTFLFNFIIDGNPLSISSYIKNIEREPGLNILISNLTQGLGNYCRYLFITTVSILLIFLIFLEKRNPNIFNQKLPIFEDSLFLFLSSISFLVFHTLFGQARDWYFAPTGISLIFLLDRFIDIKTLNIKRLIIISLAFLISIQFSASIGYFMKEKGNSLYALDFVNNTKNLIPKKSRVYVIDGSGYLSWALLPNINVVNGDGLINSYSYYKMLTQKRLDLFIEYLKNNNIEYYITNGHFNHCLGNPYLFKKCDKLKDFKGVSLREKEKGGKIIEIIGGQEIVKSASKRKFMQYRLSKYPVSIFKDLPK